MSDSGRVWILRSSVLLGTLMSFVGVIVLATAGRWETAMAVLLPTAALAVLVWFAAPLQRQNPLIWVVAGSVLLLGAYPLGLGLNELLWAGLEMPEFGDPIPADMPLGFISITFLTQGLGSVASGLLLTLGLLLFPNGGLPSRRWRWVAVPVVLILSAWLVLSLFSAVPGQAQFYRESALVALVYTLTILAPLPCIASVFFRFRKADATARNQIKWVFWGGLTFVALSLISFSGGPEIFGILGLGVLAGSYAVAVSKYRLYDIDVVISRTLVYGVLAVFIGAVYVGIAVLPWIILGSEARNNIWLGIVATIVVAVSFQPLRRRLERLANRVVYGRRATPYEVLSSFSQGISTVDPDILGQVAKSLAEGTTADAASIWVGADEALHCIAAWPALPARLDQLSVSSPVVYNDEELGRVALEIPSGQPFPETDRRLLDQVAGGLGLALRNLQLTEDLRDRVDELAASRRRIVTVQDETRRKLERDLHDGAQQRLVALKIKLGIGSSMAEKAGLTDVKAMIDTVRDETDYTIDSVRDFARGIYPPLLEAEGLGQALKAQARKMPIPVTVQAAGLGRYPKDQEATIYFCVLEALQNAMKHSEASSVQVQLADEGGHLSFEVRDDGVGFDKTEVDSNGLLNMKDRVEAIGGELSIETQPSRGTRVSGGLPTSELVPA